MGKQVTITTTRQPATDREPVVQVSIRIPRDLQRDLKCAAIERETTIMGLITEAVRAYLRGGAK